MSVKPTICRPPDPNPRKPIRTVPPKSCDTHAHIYEHPSKYPFSAKSAYEPALCPLSDYLKLLDVLGIERAVIVNPTAYGDDNTPTLDAIAQTGGRFRGVAVLRPDVTEAEIARLDAGGMRGVRTTTFAGGGTPVEHIAALADKVKAFGWFIQVHLSRIDDLMGLAPLLERLPTRYVIDHQGRVRGSQGVAHPGFRALLRLLRDDEKCWSKICSFYRLSEIGPPDYGDMRPVIEALIETAPDRLIWGTNWPHPQQDGPMPNDGDLMDIVLDWMGDAAIARRIMAENPARLFGFG